MADGKLEVFPNFFVICDMAKEDKLAATSSLLEDEEEKLGRKRVRGGLSIYFKSLQMVNDLR